MDQRIIKANIPLHIILVTLTVLFWLGGCASNRPVDMTALDQQRLLLVNVDMPVARPLNIGVGGKPYEGAGYGVPVSAVQMLSEIAGDYGLQRIESWPIAALAMHCGLVQVPADADVDQTLARLQQDTRVRLAQRVNNFETQGGNSPNHQDPYFAAQFDNASSSIAQVHARQQGEGSTVAIIDTGADVLHPDLLKRVSVARNFVDNNETQFLRDIHGTAVAGIIGAEADNGEGIVGIAPLAHLQILKACWQVAVDGGARCNSFTLAKALTFVISARPDIINLSLAGPPDPLLEQLVGLILDAGAVVVGSLSPTMSESFPTSISGVVAVSSIPVARHSVVIAPGSERLSTRPQDTYDFYSGNSIASAYVAGVSALLHAQYPAATAQALVQKLQHPEQDCLTQALLMPDHKMQESCR